MRWLRWWLSPYDPLLATPFVALFVLAAWDGPHRWPGLALVLGLFGVALPGVGHLQARLLGGLERELRPPAPPVEQERGR